MIGTIGSDFALSHPAARNACGKPPLNRLGTCRGGREGTQP